MGENEPNTKIFKIQHFLLKIEIKLIESDINRKNSMKRRITTLQKTIFQDPIS